MRTRIISKQEATRISSEDWTAFCKEIEAGLASQEDRQYEGMAKLLGLTWSSRDRPLWLNKFQEEIQAKTNEELAPHGILLSMYPTRLQLMMMDALLRHSNVLKRQVFGPNATRVAEFGTQMLQSHDVEDDIVRTTEAIESKRRELFGLEMDFLAALESGDFATAEAYLTALRVKRKTASLRARNEVENWQRDLALKKYDLAMYLDSWNRRPAESVIIKENFLHDFYILLSHCLFSNVAVSPSMIGRRKMARQGQLEFGREQADLFVKSLLDKLLDRMLEPDPLTVDGFTALVWDIAEDTKTSFLRLNPLVHDIALVRR